MTTNTTALNTLERIFHSRIELYNRFGLSGFDAKTARKMFGEEAMELVEASAQESAIPEWYRDEMLEEAADVLYTAIGLVQAHGFTLADLEAAVEAKCAKNDAKTQETHALVNGKITGKAQS